MMLIEVDTRRMGDDIKKILDVQGKGAKQRAIRKTGISYATFFRLIDGPPVKNIDMILSACAYFGLSIKEYTIHV